MNVNFKNTMKISLVISYLTLLGCSVNPNGAESTADKQQDQLDFGESYHQERSLNNFNDYVEFLKNKAAQQGVSSKILRAISASFIFGLTLSTDPGSSLLREPYFPLTTRLTSSGVI